MPDKKWSVLPTSTTTADGDLFSFVDISEPDTSLKNRIITKANLITTLGIPDVTGLTGVAYVTAGVWSFSNTIPNSIIIGGSSPSITIGDGGAEDTKLVFDGSAQDFYMGLDDTDGFLHIGLGSVVGTTPYITISHTTGFTGIGVIDPNSLLHIFENTAEVGGLAGLTIEQDGTGDAIAQFLLTGARRWVIGIDNSDSDSFKFASSTDLDSDSKMIITTAGEITKPLQPAFFAYNSATDSNVTGDNTDFPVEFDTEIFDQNGDYNNTTDTFTASVSGKYQFEISVSVKDLTSSHTKMNTWLLTSNNSFITVINSANVRDSVNEIILTFPFFVDMDAADTATAMLDILNGTKVVDVVGNIHTHFSGYLVC